MTTYRIDWTDLGIISVEHEIDPDHYETFELAKLEMLRRVWGHVRQSKIDKDNSEQEHIAAVNRFNKLMEL
ncbi:MAG: hypothetical protein GY853_14505 [PVC group bacterium]|nr:hypothetical protein [PVC group bacterium]